MFADALDELPRKQQNKHRNKWRNQCERAKQRFTHLQGGQNLGQSTPLAPIATPKKTKMAYINA